MPLAKALNVSTDELWGIKRVKELADARFSALWRKLKILESFSEKERKAVLQYVNIIAEKNKVQQKAIKKTG